MTTVYRGQSKPGCPWRDDCTVLQAGDMLRSPPEAQCPVRKLDGRRQRWHAVSKDQRLASA